MQHKGCSYIFVAACCPHDGMQPCTVRCYGLGTSWQRCHLEWTSCSLTVGALSGRFDSCTASMVLTALAQGNILAAPGSAGSLEQRF